CHRTTDRARPRCHLAHAIRSVRIIEGSIRKKSGHEEILGRIRGSGAYKDPPVAKSIRTKARRTHIIAFHIAQYETGIAERHVRCAIAVEPGHADVVRGISIEQADHDHFSIGKQDPRTAVHHGIAGAARWNSSDAIVAEAGVEAAIHIEALRADPVDTAID